MNATDVIAFGAPRTPAACGVDGLKADTSKTMCATSSDKRSLRLRFDRFELDESNAALMRDGNAVALAPRVFAVLCELARKPQVLVTKNAFLDVVWGPRFVSESALKSAISTLRAALADDAKHPRYIETVSRRGYRLVAAVSAPPGLPRCPRGWGLGYAPFGIQAIDDRIYVAFAKQDDQGARTNSPERGSAC